MLKKVSTFLFLIVLLVGIIPASFSDDSIAQDEASAANGVLLLVARTDGEVDNFLYISCNTTDNGLTIQQLPADQNISISTYKNHVLANTLTLHKVFLLGQAWGEDAMAIDFSTVAAQSCFDVFPAHTLLISRKEGAPNVLAEVLSELHIGSISSDPLAALGRILIGIAELDDETQSRLITFIADNTEADADAETICAYLTDLIKGFDNYTISFSRP